MSKSASPFSICGEEVARGEAKDILLPYSEDYLRNEVSLPVRVVRAEEDGPCLFLLGAVHGDELNGTGIIHNLAQVDTPELARGTLVMVPVVNTYGLEHGSRYLPDRRDLNREFPGSATGSMTSRLAYTLFEEVVRKCDYGIDFHTAAEKRTNYPTVRADLDNDRVRSLASAFGLEIVLHNPGPKGSLRAEAANVDVPVITIEAGEAFKIEPRVKFMGLQGVRNVLTHFGMLDAPPEPPVFQVFVDKTAWVRAGRGGIVNFHIRPGDIVEEGQPLATVYCIFAKERDTVFASCTGLVVGLSTVPTVKPGDPLFNIAELDPETLEDIAGKIKTAGKKNRFLEMQRDLTTSILVEPPPQDASLSMSGGNGSGE